MKRRTKIEAAWAAWLITGAVSFGVLEGIALRTAKLPTLSHTLQRWMGVMPRNRWGAVSPFVFTVGGAALSWHIARGKCDPWPIGGCDDRT
jgi:hypothetical protein